MQLCNNYKRNKNMPTIHTDCPRCGALNAKFDVKGSNNISYYRTFPKMEDINEFCAPDELCSKYELFAICEKCKKTTILIISEVFDYPRNNIISRDTPTNINGSLDDLFELNGHVLSRNTTIHPAPDSIPTEIKFFFKEGVACLANESWNPAGTMFRTCLELLVEHKLTKDDLKELKKAKTTDLFHKIDKLSKDERLSDDLTSIATFIREDGNRGAHGDRLTKEDVMEALHFTSILLENIYTTPAKIKLSKERRALNKAKAERKAEKDNADLIIDNSSLIANH